MDFLIGSPFATPVGQRIERATSAALPSEDWGLNLEICDIINETEEGPKDAVRAIRKRIVGNRNFKEVMLVLTVLEACVKNCGYRFHMLVSTREFVEGVLVRTILPRNNPPMVVHKKVLSLIQAWADAFRSSPSLTGVVSVYEELRRKGLAFPATELHGFSPIHTPGSNLAGSASLISPLSVAPSPPSAAASALHVERLRAELDVVRGNLTLMSDLMNQQESGGARPSDTQLLQKLYMELKGTQDRVVQLIPTVSEEDLMEELLKANDDLNAAFVCYSRYMKLLGGQSTAEQVSDTTDGIMFDPGSTPCSFHQSDTISAPAHQPISQSTVRTVSSQMAVLNTSETREVPGETMGPTKAPNIRRQASGEEDVNLDSTLLSSSPNFDWMVAKGMIPVSQTNVMEDIEKWLDLDVEEEMSDNEGMTSEEFDRFLEERAKAAEHLPALGETHPACP